MTEPRIEGSLSDLKFRSPGRSATTRDEKPNYFWLGVAILIAVALVYPFYSYQVHAHLMARDLSAAMTQIEGELSAVSDQVQRQSRQAADASAARAVAQRQQGVVVAGTTIIGGTRIVIVQLGRAGLAEAKPAICRQAAARFGESLSGERLRVQRHRGSQPAVDAGTITCD